MRIGLTSPFGHPEVWRGAERYCRELAAWLVGRGHEAVWVFSAPDEHEEVVDGVVMHARGRRRAFGRGRLRIDDLLRSALPVARAVRERPLDIVQCHHYVDAAGVRVARPRLPYVMWLPGVPRRASLGGRPLHRAAFRLAAAGAARRHCLSQFAQRVMRDELGVESDVVPPGVDTALYAGPRPDGPPTVLCAAAAEDPRKRVALLVDAFAQIAGERADLRLVLASPRPEPAQALLAGLDGSIRARVAVRAGLDFRSLAALYRASTVSVLPSLDEAFGLVMVESLAAGTPVVGTDHGAIPEVLDDPTVGRLFAPDDADDLARALVAGLELGADATTADRCRAAARRWDWSEVGPRLEAIYGDVLA